VGAEDSITRIEPGHWATRLMHSNNPVLAVSHRARFRFARRLLMRFSGGRLLDYGCGDGTLFTVIKDLFPSLTGLDLNQRNIKDCRQRFKGVHGVDFVEASEIADPLYHGVYDVVTCFEVLQCCLESDFEQVMVDLGRLVATNGELVISVPIESGPALLVKHAVRSVALRRAKEKDHYNLGELLRMTFANKLTTIRRTVNSGRYDYKGFNWRRAKARIENHFSLRESHFSPLHCSRGLLSAQAWFLCQPR